MGAISVRRAKPFGSLFSTFSRHRFFDAFWSPLGSLLAPFGSLLAPVGSLLAPAGSLLAPFGSLLAHFWCPLAHFWYPLLHFGSPRDPFSHFCYILSSFFVFFGIFHENIMQNRSFKQFSLQITFSVNQIVVSRSVPNAPQQKIHPLFCNPSSRARSGTFASGNLD